MTGTGPADQIEFRMPDAAAVKLLDDLADPGEGNSDMERRFVFERLFRNGGGDRFPRQPEPDHRTERRFRRRRVAEASFPQWPAGAAFELIPAVGACNGGIGGFLQRNPPEFDRLIRGTFPAEAGSHPVDAVAQCDGKFVFQRHAGDDDQGAAFAAEHCEKRH